MYKRQLLPIGAVKAQPALGKGDKAGVVHGRERGTGGDAHVLRDGEGDAAPLARSFAVSWELQKPDTTSTVIPGCRARKMCIRDRYYPLLMVKDFNAAGFTTSDEFMTNGDVPTLATSGLIENPTNPFTGKAIDSSEKTAHPQYVIASNDWRIDENNGNQFLPGDWYSVQSDMRVSSNWQALAKNATSRVAGN